MYRPVVLLIAALLCLMAVDMARPHAGAAQRVSFPAPPPAGIFHVDEAGVLSGPEAAEIDRVAGLLLQEQDVPIVVVMLRDLASRGAAGYTIERYASELFDQWGVGSQRRNYGMLLLVSLGDRTARIELGADWRHRYDEQARYVMDSLILPEFRSGRFPEGMLAGVRGMDAMARGLNLPAPRREWWVLPSVLAVFVGVTALIFSLFYSGRKGWAFALLALLGMLLLMLSRMNVQAGGSGSGGGAFRGGSSGGGGATGRW